MLTKLTITIYIYICVRTVLFISCISSGNSSYAGVDTPLYTYYINNHILYITVIDNHIQILYE